MIPFLFGWSTNYWDSSIIVRIYQLPPICLLIFALLILKPYYLVPTDFKLIYHFGKLNLPLLMLFSLGFYLPESNSNFILVSICLVHNFSSFLFLWYVGVFWKQYSTRNLKIFEIFFLQWISLIHLNYLDYQLYFIMLFVLSICSTFCVIFPLSCLTWH